MRLLVSVRSAAEVAPAIAGGADILDAKEPARGALGPVDAATLAAIGGAMSPETPLSVALGEASAPGTLTVATGLMCALEAAPREWYVKLGLAGAGVGPGPAVAAVGGLVRRAVAAAAGPRVIVVAYADHLRAGAPTPSEAIALAARAGAYGILLDTWRKDGRALLDWIGPREVNRWVHEARQAGLLVALAGSLTRATVEQVAAMSPDIVGVRGAACIGGRAGRVDEAHVRLVRDALLGGVLSPNAQL